jgi:hypothetical protein
MSRVILRYRKPGPIPDADKDRIQRMQRVVLIDEGPRMLLVEGSELELKAALNASEWLVTPDSEAGIPSPRKRPTRRP